MKDNLIMFNQVCAVSLIMYFCRLFVILVVMGVEG